MKRILSAVLLICCVVVWMAACRNDSVEQPTSNTTTSGIISTTTGTPSTQVTTTPTVPTGSSNTTIPSSVTTVPTTGRPTGNTTVSTSSVSVTPTMPTTVPALQLPYTIPGTGLIVEQIKAFDGIYVEDGSNAEIKGVSMIMLRNFGKYDIDLATITMTYGQYTREFVVSSLPKGATIVVQEKNKMPMPAGNLTACTASVIENPEGMQLTYHDIKITENGDNSITIENLSSKDLPSVRIFYKYFMTDQQLLVGGITFTVNITDLQAGETMTIKPSHYLKGASEIVMVQTYEVAP